MTSPRNLRSTLLSLFLFAFLALVMGGCERGPAQAHERPRAERTAPAVSPLKEGVALEKLDRWFSTPLGTPGAGSETAAAER